MDAVEYDRPGTSGNQEFNNLHQYHVDRSDLNNEVIVHLPPREFTTWQLDQISNDAMPKSYVMAHQESLQVEPPPRNNSHSILKTFALTDFGHASKNASQQFNDERSKSESPKKNSAPTRDKNAQSDGAVKFHASTHKRRIRSHMVSEQRSNKKRRRDENVDSGFAKKLAKTSSTEDDEHKSAHFRSRSVLNTCRSRMTIIDPNFPRDVFQGAGEGINSRPCSDVWASPRRSFEQEKTLKSDEDRVLKLTVVLKQGELRNENFDELLAQKIKDEMEHFDRDQLFKARNPEMNLRNNPGKEATSPGFWPFAGLFPWSWLKTPTPAPQIRPMTSGETGWSRLTRMFRSRASTRCDQLRNIGPKLCWNSVDTIASTPMHKIELIKRTSSASVGQSEGKPVTNLTQAKVWNDSGTDQVFQGHPATPIPSSDQVGEENQIKIIFPRHTTIVISPASKH